MTAHTALRPSLTIPDGLSREYLEHHLVLPLRTDGGQLELAATGEPKSYVIEDMIRLFGLPVVVVPADEVALLSAIRACRSPTDDTVELIQGESGLETGASAISSIAPEDLRDRANQAPVIRFVNMLIREASAARASDIHLDAGREGLVVRTRVDGVLARSAAPPVSLSEAVISRLKLMASLDIAERRTPQDGRVRVRLDERELDLRVATAPGHLGESMTIRLLDRGGRPVGLDELGMPPEILSSVRDVAAAPHGIILSTGPTGSGKTTTLYAALALRDRAAEKIITVEDPVEYELEGVTQVPVHEKAGLTFARALKSLVRLDPDVLMIGEIRDEESADIAVRSSMTGHLVLSTLHTNDALSAVLRLTDLHVPNYMVAATVEAVIAQRLVRRVCQHCRERYRPDPQTVALLAGAPVGVKRLERGAGCEECRGTGYRGRVGLFEFLRLSEDIKAAVSHGADSVTLRETAIAGGMRTLRQDGWAKVEAGMTTVEEVLRVVQH